MRYLLPVLLLASLGLAQIFGPAGVPLSWDFGITYFTADSISASKFTSPSATSYQYFASSAAADTLVFQSLITGDGDMVWCSKEADGTPHCWLWDDGGSRYYTTEKLFVLNTVAGTGFESTAGRFGITLITGGTRFSTDASGPKLLIDPNAVGTGVNWFGETGDLDINYLNGRLQTNITTVATATTMGASDGYMYTMTANDTLRCPTTPLAGEVLMCKFTHASGGWVKGMGNTIDGAANVATSENDNVVIVWNSSTSDWEIR